MQPKLILVVGPMGSGKTTIADYLYNKYGYRKHSMATWLKAVLCQHYGLVKLDKSLVINGKSIRTLMQQLGNGLRAIDPDWHIDEVVATVARHNVPYVIDDVRFHNEVKVLTNKFKCVTIRVTVDDAKQQLIRIITRDGVVPPATSVADISETEQADIVCNFNVTNNGTKQDLYDQIDQIMVQLNA